MKRTCANACARARETAADAASALREAPNADWRPPPKPAAAPRPPQPRPPQPCQHYPPARLPVRPATVRRRAGGVRSQAALSARSSNSAAQLPCSHPCSPVNMHVLVRIHARTQACMHARKHARTHTCTRPRARRVHHARACMPGRAPRMPMRVVSARERATAVCSACVRACDHACMRAGGHARVRSVHARSQHIRMRACIHVYTLVHMHTRGGGLPASAMCMQCMRACMEGTLVQCLRCAAWRCSIRCSIECSIECSMGCSMACLAEVLFGTTTRNCRPPPRPPHRQRTIGRALAGRGA